MRNVGLYSFFICSFTCCSLYGASLLKPQTFPKTFEDLTFTQRMEVLSDGYEVLETTYDANGRCISGCAYHGITVMDDMKCSEQNTAAARQQMYNLGYQIGADNVFVKPEPEKPQTNTPQSVIVQNAPRCTPVKSDIPVGQTEPVGEPLVGHPRITSSYGFRKHPVTGEYKGHNGIDFAAPIGTSVFSPATGTVAAVWKDNSCGNGVKITHSNGYETVYCHLSKQLVEKGESVSAGCEIAKTGNTGISTGPHLHYSIKYNGNYTNPKDWIGRN